MAHLNHTFQVMSKLKVFLFVLALPFLMVDTSSAQQKGQNGPGYTMKEIWAKIDSVAPDPEDFQFNKPSRWSSNLVRNAQFIAANSSAESDSLSNITDGRPASTWESKNYDPSPELVLDLGQAKTLNKLVVFNKHTDARGTAGGNNAVSKIEVQVSESGQGTSYRTAGHFEIAGPKQICFPRKGGGQVCTYIPRTDPSVVDLNGTKVRRVKLVLEEAHWGKSVASSWKSSIALSEVMLYQSSE